MDRAARSLMCVFGAGCKHGLNCHRGHTGVEKKIFVDKKEIREKEWMAPCAFCAVGQCRYGAECQRSIRSRLCLYLCLPSEGLYACCLCSHSSPLAVSAFRNTS